MAAVGNENMPVSKNEALHQRHKSTGNLQIASRVGGLQAAAKRTVFGDVSNVVKNLTNGAGAIATTKGKPEAAPKAASSSQPAQGFSKPAQRSVAASTRAEPKAVDLSEPALYNTTNNSGKLNVLSDALPETSQEPQVYSTAPASYLDLPPQEDLADMLYPISQYVSRDAPPGLSTGVVAPSDLMIKSMADPLASVSALSLGPRHHKSQPALKKSAEAQAQALRRTQSKQFAGQTFAPIKSEPCTYLDDLTEASYEDALEQLLDDQLTGPVDVRNLVGPVDLVEKAESVDSDSVEHGQALVAVKSEVVELDQQQVTFGEQPRSPATVPLDEYWDELEEESAYDDAGYTTAHSFRSRCDMTGTGPTVVMAPRISEAVERELEVARLYVEANRTPEDIEDDIWDVCMVAEYGEEIFEYMRELEVSHIFPRFSASDEKLIKGGD
jgi:hypothetical protein